MSKGRPRLFDKTEALETALQLFWRYGYEGVSIATLAQSMGINIPSLYSAFGSKEKLFMAAVERYGNIHANFYATALAKPSAKEVIREILKGELELVIRDNTPNGCLMVQGALVTSPEMDGLSQFMAKLRLTAEGWMADRLQKAIDEGDLPKTTDAKALACYLMTINSGLAVQARTGVTKEELNKVIEIALMAI